MARWGPSSAGVSSPADGEPVVDRRELRGWIDDALRRHDRDVTERGETIESATVAEIVDDVWGRLPLEVRRRTTPAQVQASLTMLAVRRGVGVPREHAAPSHAIEE